MSPHVLIGLAIERLEQRYSALTGDQVETLIVTHFTADAIDADEFKHYCERVRRIAERHKEAA